MEESIISLVAATLVHSSYQGLIVAVAAAVVTDRLQHGPAVHRLRVLGVALLALVLALAVTFAVLWSSPPASDGAPSEPVWTTPVVLAWLAGVALSGVRAGSEALRVEWLRLRSIPAPPALVARFDALARELGVRGRVGLRLVANRHSPMAVGVARRLVLPRPASWRSCRRPKSRPSSPTSSSTCAGSTRSSP